MAWSHLQVFGSGSEFYRYGEKLAWHGLVHRSRLPLLFVSVTVQAHCSAAQVLKVFFNSPALYMKLTASICVTGGFLSLLIPSPWANCPLFLFSPSSQYIWTVFLFLHLLFWWSWINILSILTTISFTAHWLHIIIFVFIISIITASPSLLAYLHCDINSKLYSMLSTCLFPPISIPRRSISASRPRLLSSERTTARSRGAGETRWRPTSQNCPTWCPPVARWHANQTNWPSCEWPCLIWSLWEGVGILTQMGRTNPHFSPTRYEPPGEKYMIQWIIKRNIITEE